MTNFDVEMGLRQIASMLKSGITLLNAIGTVGEQATCPRAMRTWRGVAAAVLSGESFAGALGKYPKYFDEIVVRLVEVGEKSGELERTVTHAADQMEARRNLKTSVVNALVYPLTAVVMAVAVSTFLVVTVIPKVAEFLQSSGTALPPVTQALMDFSAWVNDNGVTIIVSLVLVLAVWFTFRIFPFGREIEDAMLMKVPITGRILRLSGTALFARSMQILTESAVPLLDALSTVARLLPNKRLAHRVKSAYESILRGSTLAESLSGAVEFTPMLRRMAAVGEVGGSLPDAFGESARFHEMLLAIAVKRFGMLIEPVMIVVTGGIVGFVYIAFFMALFAIAGTN
jgi:type IV pilus assembly protein PilC